MIFAKNFYSNLFLFYLLAKTINAKICALHLNENQLEVERAGNFSARELSWAFQIMNLASWAEPSFFRFWIWWAELSWAQSSARLSASFEPSFSSFHQQYWLLERAGNFSARELSWAFQILNLASWAESSFFRFWIWRAELSWAFSDFEFGELSWAELARAKRAKKRAQTEAQIIDMASWMSWIL